MHRADRAAAVAATKRHGLFTRSTVLDAGGDSSLIHRRVAEGRWIRLDTNVFTLAGVPSTWRRRLLAAILAGPDGAVASHRSAAVLWGIEDFREGPPEITVPVGSNHRRPGTRVHESTDLAKAATCRRDAIPVTGLARTVLDLGAVIDEARLELVIDDLIRRRRTTWPKLADTLVIHARRGRRGIGPLRHQLEARYGERVPGSTFNRLVLRLLARSGLPVPVAEHPVELPGGRSARIDLAYPTRMVAIECDGSIHLRPDVFQKDLVRQNALVLLGWTVLRFTWHDLTRRPDQLVDAVRLSLRRAG